MTGSDRIIDHTTFDELQWRRDPFASAFFALAPGFQKHVHMFPEGFIEVLKDIHALQCIQDLPGLPGKRSRRTAIHAKTLLTPSSGCRVSVSFAICDN